LIATAPARSDGELPSEWLKPEEIAEGWILLFDHSSHSGWRALDGRRWNLWHSALAQPEGNKTTMVTSSAFSEYELRLKYSPAADSEGKLILGCDPVGKGGYEIGLGRRSESSEVRVSVRTKETSITFDDGDGGKKSISKISAVVRPGNIALAGTGMLVSDIE